MKGKQLLAAFLLGMGLCFVPALGMGKSNNGNMITRLNHHIWIFFST